MSEFDNWIAALGEDRRFGVDDRIGTANYIDHAARRRAATSIRSGECVTLARPLVDSATGESDQHDFLLNVSGGVGPVGFVSEILQLRCHGLANTHLDAISHVSIDGHFYGGRRAGDPDLSSMADLAVHGLFTRGVLANIPATRGTNWVEVDQPVTADDIERSLANVQFEPGDALLLYMGRDRFEESHEVAVDAVRPGVGQSAAEWIVDNRVSILCWDFLDSNHPQEPRHCVHRLIWAIGLLLVDNCDLSRAVEVLRNSGGSVGALAVSPIAVPGGTGCTVTPLLVI